MIPIIVKIVLTVIAYLLGSIATSVWIGRFFYGIDIREHGSKNAGATNTFRVLGVKAGIPVLIIDIFKGWCAVKLTYFSHLYAPGTSSYINFELILGAAALLGHIFPIYVGFRGGKGVAILLGIVLAVHPYPALISMAIFVITLFTTRYVSLSSIVAGLSFPILVIGIFKTTIVSLIIFSLILAVILVLTHQKNIGRLLRREEAKTNIFRKKSRKFRLR